MSLELDPKQTALILIDLEHGIVSRDLQPHAGKDVVARSAKLAAAMRHAGGTVVYVHVKMDEILYLPADMQRPGSDAPPPPPEASEIVPEAGLTPGDLVITKRQWGAFYGTALDQLLRRRKVDTLIMAGIATNIGVESTARAALDRGYQLIFAEDAMSTMSVDMHRFATETMFPIMGRVRSSQQILSALGAN